MPIPPPDQCEPASDLLSEQLAYYRALAAEYGDHSLRAPGGEELEQALDRFAPNGDVLELACGPGTWTGKLLRHASTVTALDAAPEMLELARARVRDPRARFMRGDLFSWRPERRYDVVFFGFWLSHVPPERFDAFWSLVAACLERDGRVFFIDDGYRSEAELIAGERPSVIRRRLNDGTSHRIVKTALEPRSLEDRLSAIGWRVAVRPTAGPFFWGAGRRG